MAWEETRKDPRKAIGIVRVRTEKKDGWELRVSEWDDGRFSVSADNFDTAIMLHLSLSERITTMDEACAAANELRDTWLAGVEARAASVAS